MGKIRLRAIVCVFVIVCLCGGLPRPAYALRNYENHPELAKAMEFDPETNGGRMDKADRTKAEYHYLRYLQDVNDSFQRARVYCQLGAMYAVTYNEKRGETKDREKARYYYRKVLEAEPNRLGRPTMVARSMLTTLENPDWMDRVKAGVEFYQWLDSFDEEAIKEKWLPLWKRPAAPAGENATPEAHHRAPHLLEDPNVPTPQELIGKLRALEDYKEAAIYNAIYDARAMDSPEEGLLYILENLPQGAAERAMVETAIKNLSRRVVDEGLRKVLDPMAPSPEVLQHVATLPRHADPVSGEDPNRVLWEITTVRRRFVPHVAHAREQGLGSVLDLKTGTHIRIPDQDAPDGTTASAHLAQAGKGDLAWVGALLAVRRGQIAPKDAQAAVIARYTPGQHARRYELVQQVCLPCTLVVRTAEKTCYLVKIMEIKPTGIDVLYRRLSVKEFPTADAPWQEMERRLPQPEMPE